MSNTIPRTPEEFADEAAGPLRLLPSVTFATRAAALSTVALPVAMLAASLATGMPGTGAEDLSAQNTTCCPPRDL